MDRYISNLFFAFAYGYALYRNRDFCHYYIIRININFNMEDRFCDVDSIQNDLLLASEYLIFFNYESH